jgi:ubiquinone/menaquinone biosynthesis C-methylase UbiE
MAYCTDDARLEFDGWSRHYDRNPLQNLLFKPSHRMLLEGVGLRDRRILDVGCGTNRFAARVIKRFPHVQVIGLDLCARMLRRSQGCCRETHRRAHRVQGNSEHLPFADNTFDLVTCSHSFHHYPEQGRVVAEMHRVLKPGGRLMIIDGDRDRWWGRLIFDVLVVLMEGRVRHLTGRAFQTLYRASGFEKISQRRRGGLIPFLLTIGEAVKPAATVSIRMRRAA